jgi:hypothetical protein
MEQGSSGTKPQPLESCFYNLTQRRIGRRLVIREKMKGYTGLWVTGCREILQIA